jgi:transcriptional regulator of acetoin/glycerol metabolism
MEWIAEVNRIDHLLHSLGVPSEIRGPAVAEIATLLAQAAKHRRERRDLVRESLARHNGNVRKAAKAEGWSHETFYAELRPKKVKSDEAA